MRNAHYVEVPGTGHGFGRPVRWGPAFDQAFADLWNVTAPPPKRRPTTATLAAVEQRLDRLELPLEYRWASGEPSAYVIFFSGDGGWATLDEAVATHLASRGIAVVGLSSLRYFWREKTAAHVAEVLRNLVAAVGKPVFVGGYSFGAEVISVALREWPASERAAIGGLVLIGPGLSASFEIDPLDWIRTPSENPATRVAPAVRDAMLPTLCVMGAQESDTACRALETVRSVRVISLPGSHHFDGNYTEIADRIAAFVASSASGSGSALKESAPFR
jgi:type IV secretory pathway VirJ component